MWAGSQECVEDPTHSVLKDCSRRPPSRLSILDSSQELGDFFQGRSHLLLLAENEVSHLINSVHHPSIDPFIMHASPLSLDTNLFHLVLADLYTFLTFAAL
jgi:hypothetical protein